jgi:hypothetical protein
MDMVGMLDRFNLFYQITRRPEDFITIGTDTGFRYQPTESSLEWTRFFFNKGLADIVPMLDLTGIFDGLNSNVTIQKQETTIIGFGSSTGIKVSGSQLERIPFSFFKTAGLGGAGSANTVVTIGSDNGRRFQPSESSLENTKFTFIKTPGTSFGVYDPTIAIIGFGDLVERPRIGRLSGLGFFGNEFVGESTKFDITKLALQGVNNTWSGYINNSSFAATAGARGERIYVGDPLQGVYPLRRSGAQAENVGFNFFKTAKAGSSVTWSISVNTIDRDPDFEWNASSVTLTYGPSDLDAIGMADRWWMAFGVSRSPIDSITIGSGVDDRLFYTTEKTTFAVFKTLFDKDVPGTTGAIVTLLDDLIVAPGRGVFDLFTVTDNSRFSPYPAKDFFKTTGIGGAGSSNTIIIVGSGEDRRSALSERTFFTVTKSRFDFDVPGTTGAIVTLLDNDAALTFGLDAKQSVDTTITGFINASSVTNLARSRDLVVLGDPFRGVHPLRRSGNQTENVSVQYGLTAKRGASTTLPLLQFIDGNNGYVSAAVVTFTAPDTDVVGVFGGINDVRTFVRYPWHADYLGNSGAFDKYVEPLERAFKLVTKRVFPDDNPTTSHHLIYTSGDVKTIQFTKSARRGVAGTLLLNTIDPNPDVEWQQSSVAVTANAWDSDAVGTLDYFSIYYMLYRQFDEYLTLGSGIDQRQTTTENIKFLITKLLGDTTAMLDLTEVYDGLVYTSALYKADTQIISSGQTSQTFPARTKSGATERVSFDVVKAAEYSGNTITFSGNTVTAGDTDRLFVGQQYGTTRFANDPQERILFTISARLGNARDTSVQTLAVAGSGVDDRLGYANEKTFFTVSKARFDRDVAGTTGALVTMGRGTSSVTYPERRSGDSLDNPAFLYGLRANRGVTGTVTLKLIDPTDGNGFNSSAAVTYQDWDYDVVGSIDFMSAVAATGRSIFDLLTIGTDTGFRNQPSQSSLENTKFTIGKFAKEYDGTTSYAQIGWGDLIERSRVGTLTVDINNNLYGETTFFNITKLAKLYDGTTSRVILGRGTTSVAFPERRSGDSLDNPAFQFSLDAKINFAAATSVTYTLSGTTVTARDRDRVYVGQQSWQGNTGGFRNAGDSQERILFTVGKKADSDGAGSSVSFVVIGAGNNYGFRYQASENTSETVKFTVTKSRFDFDVPGTTGAIVIMGFGSSTGSRVSGSLLENIPFNFIKTAKRSVAGNVTLNTIDPNPDVEFFVSSVTISRGDWQLDEVGMLDRFNLFYQITRTIDQDFVTIGLSSTATGIRTQPTESRLEFTTFLIGKLLGDDTAMLDLTEVYDGLVYNSTILKRETQIMGFGSSTGVKVTGSLLENIPFDVYKDIKQGSSTTNTVSGTTVTASDRDRIFVGQQSWQGNTGGRRNSGDTQERIFYTLGKFANPTNPDLTTIGYGDLTERPRTGPTINAFLNIVSGEGMTFVITKSRFDRDVAGTTGAIVVMGRESTSQTYPERRSGDSLDNPAFLYGMRANRGVTGTVTLKLIDPINGDAGQSSAAVTYQDWDYDVVGAVDFMFVQMIGTGRAFLDSILIGTDNGFRYQSSENTSETVKFTIGKRATEYDGSTSYAVIGYGDLTGRARTGGLFDTGSNLVGEATKFNVTKSRVDSSFGTSGSLITLGRGTSSVTYPERRSGDSLDNPAFQFSLDAKINGAAATSVTYTVSSTTITARDKDRVFVGQQSWQGNIGGFRNAGDGQERILFTVGKKADADGAGSSIAYVVVGAGDNYGFRYQQYENSSETVKFTITKSRFDKDVAGTTGAIVIMGRESTNQTYPERRSGDSLDNPAFLFGMRANRGVTGTVTLKLIDPTDGNGFQSSAAVTYQDYDYDVVGIVDFFSAFAATGRSVNDAITIGTDLGFRYQSSQNTSETVRFTIGKNLGRYGGHPFDAAITGEGTTMLDSTDLYDNLTYSSTMLERENLTIGFGSSTGVKVAGSLLETIPFLFSLDAKAGRLSETYTVSGVTVLARDRDRIFVGQQPWQGNTAIRNAGDRQERIFYTVNKAADADGVGSSTAFVVAGAGNNYGFRYQASENTSETVKFTITKARFDFDVPGTTGAIVTMGFGSSTGGRVSGSLLEQTNFDVRLTAKAGTVGNYSFKNIDGPNASDSSILLSYQSWQPDIVGIIDSFNSLIFIGRITNDTITIGTDTGFRYQPSQNTSETVKFTIGKRLGQDDGTIMLDLTEVYDGLVYNTTMIKREALTIGRGTTSVAYPERRSGDSLDNPAFQFSLDAKINGAAATSVTYTVSGSTVTARDRDRVVVGQQTWQGNTSRRNAGDSQERIFYTVSKAADADGLGSSTAFVVAGAGDNYGFRYQASENTSETVKFTVTKSRFDFDVPGTTGAIVTLGRNNTSQTYPERRSGDSLDNPAFTYIKTAKRGVAGNVTLNTIDPNPDVEYQQSSVTVSRGDWQLDEVGMLDFFNLYYVINRFNAETITIGTDTGFRNQRTQSNAEWTTFVIGKLLGDTTAMLDLTEVYDGLVYNTTMLKREALTMGFGSSTGVKVAGSLLETIPFLFSLDAKVNGFNTSVTYTVSGVTVTARDRDRLFVGQQSWQGNTGGKRNSGDSQERILFTVAKSADQDGAGSSVSFVVAGAGNNYGFRYQASENTSETVKFTITKTNFDRDVAGTTGAIVTIDTNDADLLFSLDAKQGTGTTTTLSSTTVRARDRDRVFLGQQSWQGNQGKRVSGDALESFVINLYKPFTETSTTILDRTALYGQKGGISDDLTMLGEGVEFMNLNFFSPKVDSMEITDLLVINVVFPLRLFDNSGDLDLNGNINTVASNGNLRMTDYADIDYFEDDFVGEKRSFT